MFNVHCAFYTVPLCIRFKKTPVFAAFMIMAVYTSFNFYTSLGEAAVVVSFLTLFPEAIRRMRWGVVVIYLFVFSTALGGAFWYVWMLGTGNANFYFSSNIVYLVTMLFLMVDAGHGMAAFTFHKEWPKIKGKIVRL